MGDLSVPGSTETACADKKQGADQAAPKKAPKSELFLKTFRRIAEQNAAQGKAAQQEPGAGEKTEDGQSSATSGKEDHPAGGTTAYEPIPGLSPAPKLRVPIAAPKTAGAAPKPFDPKAVAGDLASKTNQPDAFAQAAKDAGLEDPAKMKAVLNEAVGNGSGWLGTTYDTSKAADILNGAAKSSDAGIRTSAYNAGAAKLAEIGGNDPALKAALANLAPNVDPKKLDENGKKAVVDASVEALRTGRGNAGTILNGLNSEQKAEVAQGLQNLPEGERNSAFASIAKTANGKQLADLTRQLQPSAQSELAEAIRDTDGNNKAKIDYVRELAPGVAEPGRHSAAFPPFAHSYDDATAKDVATVLSSPSLTGKDFDDAIRALGSNTGERYERLNTIMRTAQGKTGEMTLGGEEFHYDTKLAQSLIERASSGNDPEMKAIVFMSGMKMTDELREAGVVDGKANTAVSRGAEEITRNITTRLSQLLNSDFKGVTDKLADLEGGFNSFAKFVGLKIGSEAGQQEMGAYMRALMYGRSDTSGLTRADAKAYLDQDEKAGYPNASRLAFFMAAMDKAVKQNSLSAQEQADLISILSDFAPKTLRDVVKRGGKALAYDIKHASSANAFLDVLEEETHIYDSESMKKDPPKSRKAYLDGRNDFFH